MSFTAQFYGTCGECGDRIEPGDEITYNDGETVHDYCVEDDKPAPRRQAVAVAVAARPKVRVCAHCHQEIPLALGHCENC